MLSKCANPACSTVFRYMSEGKLFLIDPRPASEHPAHGPKGANRRARIQYAWLCSSCSRQMTIRIDEEVGITVLRKLELPSPRVEST
jgi:hypothetical protein